MPILLLPQALVLAWWARNRTLLPLDAVVACFARGLAPYAALTFLFEAVFVLLVAMLMLGLENATGASRAATAGVLCVWSLLAVVEEAVKYRYVNQSFLSLKRIIRAKTRKKQGNRIKESKVTN